MSKKPTQVVDQDEETEEELLERQPWRMILTPEQWASLPGGIGSQVANYWAKWRPQMCKKLKKQGKLYETIKAECWRIAEMRTEMAQKKYPLDVIQEFINQEVYSLPPEKGAERAYRMRLGLDPDED